MPQRLLLFAGIVIALIVAGCEPGVKKLSPVQKILPPQDLESEPEDEYRIGAGDEVELKFFFTPELNDRLTVRPDGKISVMFAGDIQAAGETAEDLTDTIKHKLAAHLKQLDLVVIVRTFASQKIYVGGEVAKPGPVMTTGHETLLQVIDDAGWLTPLANRKVILIVRRNEENKDEIYPINMQRILSGEDMSQDVMLQAGDLVLVPPSDTTSVDRWVDQSIRQMIPITTGVFVNTR